MIRDFIGAILLIAFAVFLLWLGMVILSLLFVFSAPLH